MASIRFPIEKNEISDRLILRSEATGEPTFGNNAQVAVFAAMVGFFKNEGPYEKKQFDRTGREIPQSALDNTDKEGLAYLLAIHSTNGDVEIFRDSNDREIWEIFENYAAGGLEEIEHWLADNPSDLDAYTTLLNEMKLVASELKDEEIPTPEQGEPVRIEV